MRTAGQWSIASPSGPFRGDKQPVTVAGMATGRKKLGAMVGDEAEIGCHTVLNPGTVIGSHSNVYPLSSVRGYVPENHIYKSRGEIVKKS